MIGALLSSFFNLILKLMGTILQLLLAPLNGLFSNLFPDLSNWISQVVAGFNSILSGLGWAIGLLPPSVRSTLLIIFAIEISLVAILKSTMLTSKLWRLIQKIKVW